jgi:histidine triad (HIT) family protein
LSEENCPFCIVVAGVDDPSIESKQSDVFYRGLDVVAFISAGWWPNNPGSVLIVPVQHYRSIYDIPATAYAAVNELGRRVGITMKREYGCDGISFRQHNEAAGGQSVDHFHLWVFPRYRNDRLYELYSQGSIAPIELRNEYARRLERSLELP